MEGKQASIWALNAYAAYVDSTPELVSGSMVWLLVRIFEKLWQILTSASKANETQGQWYR